MRWSGLVGWYSMGAASTRHDPLSFQCLEACLGRLTGSKLLVDEQRKETDGDDEDDGKDDDDTGFLLRPVLALGDLSEMLAGNECLDGRHFRVLSNMRLSAIDESIMDMSSQLAPPDPRK